MTPIEDPPGSVPSSRGRVLLTVSGTIDPDVHDQVARGTRPRPDYLVLADELRADIVDVAEARRRSGRLGRLIERAAGRNGLLAWTCFREQGRYDAILTDGEQVGLPLALLARLRRRRRSAVHIMIAHILSVPKKHLLFRTFRLGGRLDAIVLYSSWQRRYARDVLGFPDERMLLTPFTVDTRFFAPVPDGERNGDRGPTMIATAGLEYRDYPTLIEAARGLEARVVIAAASNWSKRSDNTAGVELPGNVEVHSLRFEPLRQLYADARFIVMPLVDVEFQAGVTTILEAMAMGKAVLCSRTKGQTDVIVDGETGVYVPPGNSRALRSAIEQLLTDPDRLDAMGRAARSYAEQECDVEVYARRLGSAVENALALRRQEADQSA